MELRQSLRFPLQCPVGLLANGRRVAGKMVNLSTSGCGVESIKSLQKGHQLSVLLHIPDGNPPMEIDMAVVRWSRGQQFGLKFLTIQREQLVRLRRFVSALERERSHFRKCEGEVPLERRRGVRFPVQFTFDFSGQHTAGVGTVSDLSVGGCQVNTKTRLYIGTYLPVRLYLPGQEATLKIPQAAVRWAKAQQYGLGFMSMWPEEEAQLRDAVSTLEAGQSH